MIRERISAVAARVKVSAEMNFPPVDILLNTSSVSLVVFPEPADAFRRILFIRYSPVKPYNNLPCRIMPETGSIHIPEQS